MTGEATLGIGEVAREACVSAFLGDSLLRAQWAAAGGRAGERQAPLRAAMVRRLGVIDVAKQAGFSLDEVRALLDSIDRGSTGP